MFAPTCFCTVRKFCRNVLKETSAQVGRVATRLRISAVLATFAIIAAAARTPRLRRGYSRLPAIHRVGKVTASAVPLRAQMTRASAPEGLTACVYGEMAFGF